MKTRTGLIVGLCAGVAAALWLACGDKISGEKDLGLETGSLR
ncbi:MAG: hypothetical protein ACUVTG_05605 [Candidatus Oleimicrobiaceae bacterium]